MDSFKFTDGKIFGIRMGSNYILLNSGSEFLNSYWVNSWAWSTSPNIELNTDKSLNQIRKFIKTLKNHKKLLKVNIRFILDKNHFFFITL